MNWKQLLYIFMAIIVPPLMVLATYMLFMGTVFLFMKAHNSLDLVFMSAAIVMWIWVSWSVYRAIKK